jgi:pimeloyl-ACP methyl ester carboxylesterase
MLDDAGKPTPSPLPGRSDPVTMPRTGADVVTELHDLLTTAGVSGPYVLAGHSLGGLFQLLYARTYPDEVAGLVLIDATSPALQQLLTPSQFTEFLQEPLLHPGEPVAGYGFEAYDVERTFQQLGAAAPLPRTPAVVLAAAGIQPGAPPAVKKVMTAILPKAQAALAASVPGSKLTTVPDTTHYIQVERPDVVIDTIRTVKAG